MNTKNFWSSALFSCPDNAYYLIKYNPELFSEGEPKYIYLDSRRQTCRKRRVLDTAIIPARIDKIDIGELTVTTTDNKIITIHGLTYDIQFVNPNIYDNTGYKKNEAVHEKYIRYISYFHKTEETFRQTELTEKLKQLIRKETQSALASLSFFDLWINKTVENVLFNRFEKYPFNIIKGTIDKFTINELTNLNYADTEITYTPESEAFITNQFLKLNALVIRFKIKLNQLSSDNETKYKNLFDSLDIQNQKTITEWIVSHLNLEMELKKITYAQFTSPDRGGKQLKSIIESALSDYPISLLSDSIYISFDESQILQPDKIINICLQEEKIRISEDALIKNVKICFPIFIDTSDTDKFNKLLINTAGTTIEDWIGKQFKPSISNYFRALSIHDLIENTKIQDLNAFIVTLLGEYSIKLPENESVHISFDEFDHIEKLLHEKDSKIEYDALPIINYKAEKIKQKYQQVNRNLADISKETEKRKLIETYSKKTALLESETAYLISTKDKETEWRNVKKDEIKAKLQNLLLFDKAKNDFLRENQDDNTVGFISDIGSLNTLDEMLSKKNLDFSEMEYHRKMSDILKEFNLDKAEKDNKITLENLQIELDSIKDKYNFDKNTRWSTLLNQSIHKDNRTVDLLQDLLRFLVLLQYSEKDAQGKQRVLEMMTSILNNDHLNANEIIKIINHSSLEKSTIDEFLKRVLTQNHFNDLFEKTFNTSAPQEEDNHWPNNNDNVNSNNSSDNPDNQKEEFKSDDLF